jgi:hypothetical protein
MTLSLDGQVLYEKSVSFEVMPYAVDFVCPGGIDIDKLPRVYGRSEN